jgi:hypothetical protein
MNNLFWKRNGCIAVIVLVFLLLPVIASYSAEKEIAKTRPPVRLAVIPFQAVSPIEEVGNTVVCPLCGAIYFGGKIAKGGEKVVEELFIEKIKDYKEVEIIPEEKVVGIYKRVSSESLKMPLTDIVTKTGAELNADLIAVGYVFRYVERIGYDYSVEQPTSVAFEINFINPKDGSIVWRGVFDKTQKSLMEDLFQIASFRGKWLTAHELTKQGIKQAFKTFPGFEH